MDCMVDKVRSRVCWWSCSSVGECAKKYSGAKCDRPQSLLPLINKWLSKKKIYKEKEQKRKCKCSEERV